jgi:Ubiquitin fusion degradation protein UFD1
MIFANDRALLLLLPCSLFLMAHEGVQASSSTGTSLRPPVKNIASRSVLSEPPLSLSHGIGKVLSHRWHKAQELAQLEQTVEDYNAEWIATSRSAAEAVRHRRLIALPLDDGFDPPMGVFSHKHVQTGDKMSLPSNFWSAIQLNSAEVPWLFAVKRVEGVTSARVELVSAQEDGTISPHRPLKELDRMVGGPLDFRAPNSYVFLPLWMMRALGIRPRDVVEVELIETVPAGSLAKLRPHSSDFAKNIANPQAVLETELRHYSALCQGSTIAFDYNARRYWFDVVELRSAPRGEKASMIKVQDCDIATDFLVAKDALKKAKKSPSQRQSDR